MLWENGGFNKPRRFKGKSALLDRCPKRETRMYDSETQKSLEASWTFLDLGLAVYNKRQWPRCRRIGRNSLLLVLFFSWRSTSACRRWPWRMIWPSFVNSANQQGYHESKRDNPKANPEVPQIAKKCQANSLLSLKKMDYLIWNFLWRGPRIKRKHKRVYLRMRKSEAHIHIDSVVGALTWLPSHTHLFPHEWCRSSHSFQWLRGARTGGPFQVSRIVML